jgi:xanthine dehydrogenase YagR molybdenum-binding subunit
MTTTAHIGQPASRVDGRAKVTGEAKYAAEFSAPGLLYGHVVSSAIAKGRIRQIDTRAALAVPGILDVLTHQNRPKLPQKYECYQDDVAPDGSPFRPLYDDRVRYCGQPIALVIAEELEIARHAASLVRVAYDHEPHVTDFLKQWQHAYEPERPAKPRGDAERAFRKAAVQVEAEYWSPIEHHNPIETHAATVIWEGHGRITVYDKIQGVKNSQKYVANVFGMSHDDVRVVSRFVGGAFGSGLRPQYHLALAVMAARAFKRSVRVVLTRQQMFTFGYRPGTWQRLALGANADGTLTSIRHDAVSMTSRFENFRDEVTTWSALLYKCANTRFTHKLAQLDLYTPADMRAPGGATGVYALECAMDELAARAGIDPLQLRLVNYSDRDQIEDRPYSSKQLRECYRQGAEKFGWDKRKPQPRSMRDGRELVGWGMATGIWDAFQKKANAKVALTADGKLEVGSATADIGPGTYTIMTQIAADMLGLPMADVTANLGDSSLPDAPVEGGSFTAASVGTAIHKACDEMRMKIFGLAQRLPGSPFAGMNSADVTFADGHIRHNGDPSRNIAITDVMRQAKVNRIEKVATGRPSKEDVSRYTHSAIFAEVKVDEQLGVVRVTRVVNAVAAGRILNPKTARSQILGAVVGGIGMALEEETLLDHELGRIVNNNLGEYHVPVNADIYDIDAIFVDERDDIINPLGVKGVGEIGIVGTAAAIANAVYHATGVRVRDLPITLDKLFRAA